MRALPLVCFALASVALASCGDSSSPGVASVGSTSTTTSPSGNSGTVNAATAQANYRMELAFSKCMRSHGVVNFPNPQSISGGMGFGIKVSPRAKQSAGDTTLARASQACRHLLPNGGIPTAAQRQQMQAGALAFAKCMRSHGVQNFPDPSIHGAGIQMGGPGLDPSSPTFQRASRVCQNRLPSGKGTP